MLLLPIQLIFVDDDQRIDYLTDLISKLVKLDRKTANELAIVEYAAFLGLQYLLPDGNSRQKEYFITLVTEIISSYSIDTPYFLDFFLLALFICFSAFL